jgi:hypothetical protein
LHSNSPARRSNSPKPQRATHSKRPPKDRHGSSSEDSEEDEGAIENMIVSEPIARKPKPNETGTRLELQSHNDFFGDNWKTQSKLRKKMGNKSSRAGVRAGERGNGERGHGGRGMVDDVDDILDEYSGSEEEDGSNYRRSSQSSGRKYNDDEEDGTNVKVGRHVLPRFESLLASDDERDHNIDDVLGNGMGDINMGTAQTDSHSSTDKSHKKKKSHGKNRHTKSRSNKHHESKTEDLGRNGGSSKTQDAGEEEKSSVGEEKKKMVKKKKKKKKSKKPRPPSPMEEPREEPLVGASANTVRMDSNFLQDDWDSD